jgi:hypothetical protein
MGSRSKARVIAPSAEYASLMSSGLPDAESLQSLFPQLRLLVMHGSRARGDAHEASDWVLRTSLSKASTSSACEQP